MASSSGSSDMSIRNFDGMNFNFWKEQMQDYLILRGYIDHYKGIGCLPRNFAASFFFSGKIFFLRGKICRDFTTTRQTRGKIFFLLRGKLTANLPQHFAARLPRRGKVAANFFFSCVAN
jgi:hypothetical protein